MIFAPIQHRDHQGSGQHKGRRVYKPRERRETEVVGVQALIEILRCMRGDLRRTRGVGFVPGANRDPETGPPQSTPNI